MKGLISFILGVIVGLIGAQQCHAKEPVEHGWIMGRTLVTSGDTILLSDARGDCPATGKVWAEVTPDATVVQTGCWQASRIIGKVSLKWNDDSADFTLSDFFVTSYGAKKYGKMPVRYNGSYERFDIGLF